MALMASAGTVTVTIDIVRPKVVHLRDRSRASNPACGARMYPRIPALHLADDSSVVTCKRCLRYV